MNDTPGKAVPFSVATTTRKIRASVAVVGNPNCGKSTLFNRLTGLRQKTANYPGATVERTSGILDLPTRDIELVDLPGIFSMGANTLDERITVDALLGRIDGYQRPDGILVVMDATSLHQGLFLTRQLLELKLPVVVALTMTDAAEQKGISVAVPALRQALGGVPVVSVVATTGIGVKALQDALGGMDAQANAPGPPSWLEMHDLTHAIASQNSTPLTPVEVERALIDTESELRKEVIEKLDQQRKIQFQAAETALFSDQPPLAVEARIGHHWARQLLGGIVTRSTPIAQLGARVASWFNHPAVASLAFLVVMATVFQAVFAWATPVMDMIDGGTAKLNSSISTWLPDDALNSFITDGVIAGVGSVIIFLPQILLLFLFIILLEDTGFLARSAFLMDRLMRSVGLSGQSVIPMLSSFACAVPSIMATRVIPTRRERIATIMASPFMTCSARLPIYALLIAAFVPQREIGPLNLQGLVLFGLYVLGMVGGALTALLVNRVALVGKASTFAMTLPDFRRPNLRTVLIQLLDRVRLFLRRAGTVIFTVAVVVWVLAYFPRLDTVEADSVNAQSIQSSVAQEQRAADQLSQSWLGRAGRFVQPVFDPLGWDWRVSASVIAGFPAREVVVAVMGTIYAVGAEADEERLSTRLHAATWPDGKPIFTLPMVLGLLVFYAWCLQCAATIAVIRRETNSWRWPIFAWTYMTTLGYLGALVIYQLGS